MANPASAGIAQAAIANRHLGKIVVTL